MTITLSLAGLASQQYPETRALAYLDVDYDSTPYAWQIFIPSSVTDLTQYLLDSTPMVQSQIDAKEAEWAALEPKTRVIINPMTGDEITVPIQKEEIVKPDIPDYFASRRSAYPLLGDQLDAIWKGPNHPDYAVMQEQIQAVKTQYPKPT
jgi:hypothetical protein